jgi:hypothetical protein
VLEILEKSVNNLIDMLEIENNNYKIINLIAALNEFNLTYKQALRIVKIGITNQRVISLSNDIFINTFFLQLVKHHTFYPGIDDSVYAIY